jgi:hypothetical protein
VVLLILQIFLQAVKSLSLSIKEKMQPMKSVGVELLFE